MQKTLFILPLAALTLALTACELQQVPKKENKIGNLADKDQKILMVINDVMSDHIAGREAAGMGFVATPISEKASKLGRVMKENCQQVGRIPEEDVIGGLSDATISGSQCPMYWFRRRGVTTNGTQKILRIIDKYEVLDNEASKKLRFAETSQMLRRYEDGAITATYDGMKTTIQGTVRFNDYQIDGVGKVNVLIGTEQKINGDEGIGNISITINTSQGQHVGWISWRVVRNAMQAPIFTVDRVQVEEKDFNRLFSSFELGKIIATSLRMK